MNFGTVRKTEWLKFDKNAVDVLVLANNLFLYSVINGLIDGNNESEMAIYPKIENYENMDIDELFEIANNLLQKRHQFWDFVEFGGAKYVNLLNSDLNPFDGDWDEYNVLEFNINSFKIPTFILKK